MAENTGWGEGGATPSDTPSADRKAGAAVEATTPLIYSVTVANGATSGTTAHGLGRTPTIIGRPNPNKLDGLNSYASADGTNITVTTDAPVSSDTVYRVPVI